VQHPVFLIFTPQLVAVSVQDFDQPVYPLCVVKVFVWIVDDFRANLLEPPERHILKCIGCTGWYKENLHGRVWHIGELLTFSRIQRGGEPEEAVGFRLRCTHQAETSEVTEMGSRVGLARSECHDKFKCADKML